MTLVTFLFYFWFTEMRKYISSIFDWYDGKSKSNCGKSRRTTKTPYCTWNKFGEILANAGGRSFGLFDELTAFFSTTNMYSSEKMQISGIKEYQDFLQLFTGKSKTRETTKFYGDNSPTALTIYNTCKSNEDL